MPTHLACKRLPSVADTIKAHPMPPGNWCTTRLVALLLAGAVLAGAGGVLAQMRPPLPNPEFFAFRPLDTENSGADIIQANMCEEGHTVAGIAFGYGRKPLPWQSILQLLLPPWPLPQLPRPRARPPGACRSICMSMPSWDVRAERSPHAAMSIIILMMIMAASGKLLQAPAKLTRRAATTN